MAKIYLSGWVGGWGGFTMILRQSQFDLTRTGLLELSLAISDICITDFVYFISPKFNEFERLNAANKT